VIKEHLQDVAGNTSASPRKRPRYHGGSSPTEAHLIKIRSCGSLARFAGENPKQVFEIVFQGPAGGATRRGGNGLPCVRPRTRAALGWIGRLNCSWSIAWRLIFIFFHNRAENWRWLVTPASRRLSKTWHRNRRRCARRAAHTCVLGEGLRAQGRAPAACAAREGD
jgi:hypothetical protein